MNFQVMTESHAFKHLQMIIIKKSPCFRERQGIMFWQTAWFSTLSAPSKSVMLYFYPGVRTTELEIKITKSFRRKKSKILVSSV